MLERRDTFGVVAGERGWSPPTASSVVSTSLMGGNPVNKCAKMVSLKEWQGWGTSSPVPALVADIVDGLTALEGDISVPISFGSIGGKIQGACRAHEEKRHRDLYLSLPDTEKKFQYFVGRQIACRLLGSRGYLCQKCWIAMEDCMCSRINSCLLWPGIRFWVYMHPKDFLRQNNTGKLLWQLFGVESATLCIFGICEHEEIMWEAFKNSGKDNVWFLYPNKTAFPKSVRDIVYCELSSNIEGQAMDITRKPVNFLLIDGTWSNSAAMFRRLEERWCSLWRECDEENNLPCISLSNLNASVMHKLRPQPDWDRTCTAAAAAGLLWEVGLCTQAKAVEAALHVLLDALTHRRLRMGRSITRKNRHTLTH